ncbi:MAG TPA: hypothetical protein VIM29_02570 [Bacillota bacterium]
MRISSQGNRRQRSKLTILFNEANIQPQDGSLLRAGLRYNISSIAELDSVIADNISEWDYTEDRLTLEFYDSHLHL